MIYMVEQDLSDRGRQAAWDAWYLSHMKMPITIPGIQATQRFAALGEHASPFVALHEVDGPQVFASGAYRAKAGPGNTGEWRALMVNWHRNVYDGVEHTPDVSAADRLLVVEDGFEAPVPLIWLIAIGLDKSPARRAIGVATAAVAENLVGQPGARVCRPLTPRLMAAQRPAVDQ